jgi:hypothetical protein
MITIKSYLLLRMVASLLRQRCYKCLVGPGKEGVVDGREGIEGRLWSKGCLQNALDMIKCKGNQRL